jgi:3-oxoacyl-[acyl-carrier protein] reductase
MKLSAVEGKVAVVTGAAGLIGQAVVLRMLNEGAQVAAVDIDGEGLRRKFTAQEGLALTIFEADLSNEHEVSHLAHQVIEHYSRVDFLINVAGGELKPNRANPGVVVSTGMHPIETIDFDTYWRTVAINLTSAFLSCRAFVPHMKETRGGRIVNFASFATRNGSIRVGAHYAAAKGGIVGLTKTLALELAPYDITVNALAPGLIPPGPLDAQAKEMVNRIPLGCEGTPEDIASGVAVLCSSAGSYTTGTTLDINGGLYVAP